MQIKSKSIVIVSLMFIVFGFSKVQAQNLDTIKQVIDKLGNFLLYRNHDPNYIANYSDEVAVRLVLANKFNYFRLIDRGQNSSLRYAPFKNINIGAGVSYKWFAMDFTLSFGLRDLSGFKDQRSLDFQSRLYSSRQFITAILQYYRGYEMYKTQGFAPANFNDYKIREDLRMINFGLQYMYAFNYTKFSLKAPFVFNEIQKRSAGSVIAGASFSLLTMVADSAMVPSEYQPYFDRSLWLQDVTVLNLSFNFGYMYTLVVKGHFFLTVSLIPGLNLNSGDFLAEDRALIQPNIRFKLNTMNALGYNGRKFYAGINFIADTYTSRLSQKRVIRVGYGKMGLFIGYRFGPAKEASRAQ